MLTLPRYKWIAFFGWLPTLHPFARTNAIDFSCTEKVSHKIEMITNTITKYYESLFFQEGEREQKHWRTAHRPYTYYIHTQSHLNCCRLCRSVYSMQVGISFQNPIVNCRGIEIYYSLCPLYLFGLIWWLCKNECGRQNEMKWNEQTNEGTNKIQLSFCKFSWPFILNVCIVYILETRTSRQMSGAYATLADYTLSLCISDNNKLAPF